MLKLHTCKIAKKGKGQQGFVTVEMFGIPKLDDNGIARSFDYSDVVAGHTLTTLLDGIEQTNKLNNRMMLEAIVRGADLMNSRQSLQNAVMVNEMAEWILAQDLAEDMQKAEDLAAVWNQTQAFQKKCGILVYCKEDFAKERQKYVDSQKALGIWKSCLVGDTTPENPVEDIPETPAASESK